MIEDAIITNGSNNIPRTIPITLTIGSAQPLNKLGGPRDEILYVELSPHALCSQEENFKQLNRGDDGKMAVVLLYPVTIEFEVVYTTMLPSVLKTIQNNKPTLTKDRLKRFEISYIELRDDWALHVEYLM